MTATTARKQSYPLTVETSKKIKYLGIFYLFVSLVAVGLHIYQFVSFHDLVKYNPCVSKDVYNPIAILSISFFGASVLTQIGSMVAKKYDKKEIQNNLFLVSFLFSACSALFYSANIYKLRKNEDCGYQTPHLLKKYEYWSAGIIAATVIQLIVYVVYNSLPIV